MSESAAVLSNSTDHPVVADALADFDLWFAKDSWNLYEVAALILGLNPDVVWLPEVAAAYENCDPGDPLAHQLWRYSEAVSSGDWRDLLDKCFGNIRDDYCASELDEITILQPNRSWAGVTFKPMEIIQWCVDHNEPLHYRLREYLLARGYDFRFSENSRVLAEIRTYAKKDVWYMPHAARVLLGFSPEAPKITLQNRRNLYRHLDPNYSLTQRDEVYYVMELALESWKTKNLEFFEIHGTDPEDNYYDDEECGVDVEARKFVEWAIKKKFNPPAQLLEAMGIAEQRRNERGADYLAPQQAELFKPPFWIEFSDASGELILNGSFTLACPTPNGQNYRIIRHLIANPNRFVTADELKTRALEGKELDKRLTDFAAQVNMNKDLGKLFFDTSKDSIRLTNPVTPERMMEQNLRRVRIKPS